MIFLNSPVYVDSTHQAFPSSPIWPPSPASIHSKFIREPHNLKQKSKAYPKNKKKKKKKTHLNSTIGRSNMQRGKPLINSDSVQKRRVLLNHTKESRQISTLHCFKEETINTAQTAAQPLPHLPRRDLVYTEKACPFAVRRLGEGDPVSGPSRSSSPDRSTTMGSMGVGLL